MPPSYFTMESKMGFDMIHAGYGMSGEALELSLAHSFKNGLIELGDILYYLSIVVGRLSISSTELKCLIGKDNNFEVIGAIPDWYPCGASIVCAAVNDLADLIKKTYIYGQTNISRHRMVDAVFLVLNSIHYMNNIAVGLMVNFIDTLEPGEGKEGIMEDLFNRTFEGDEQFRDFETKVELFSTLGFVALTNQKKIIARYPTLSFTVEDSIERKDTVRT